MAGLTVFGFDSAEYCPRLLQQCSYNQSVWVCQGLTPTLGGSIFQSFSETPNYVLRSAWLRCIFKRYSAMFVGAYCSRVLSRQSPAWSSLSCRLSQLSHWLGYRYKASAASWKKLALVLRVPDKSNPERLGNLIPFCLCLSILPYRSRNVLGEN